MEEQFSDELRDILRLVEDYIDNNPQTQVILSVRDFIHERDNLVVFQTSDVEDNADMLNRIEDAINEEMMIINGEPYWKFFHFAEFTSSLN
jgi:hypothetical protein